MKWLATLLLALTTCAPTHASTASVTNDFGLVTVRYISAPGEANALVVEGTYVAPGPPVSVRFQDTGATITALGGCTASSPNDVTCTATTHDEVFVEVSAGDGDDSVTLSPLSSTDLLTVILDGEGNDMLTGGPGVESFHGALGSDVINGGEGIDHMSYVSRRTAVFVSLDGVANDGGVGEGDLVGAGIEFVWGGKGNDVLIGSPRGEGLVGTAGSDVIRGGGGADELIGSGGPDVLVGGRGRDFADGGPGADLLLMKDRTRDRIVGGPGQDRARIDRGRDRLSGVERLVQG